MTALNQAALLISQSVCALIEAIGMHAANIQRRVNDESTAYDEAAFLSLIEKYGIGWNAAVTMIREGR